ncbi:MAG: 3-keto-5-aminohexanoate cleavage protein [Anaerolineales bacterium]
MDEINDGKVIITAAINGSRPTKEMNPAVPYSPEEIAESALECWREGAAITHLHGRDPSTGLPSSDSVLQREVVERIRADSDMLINLSTSGYHIVVEDVIDERLRPLQLSPELCSLDIGSVNFIDGAFVNPPAWGRIAAETMRASWIKPEIEVFELGHIAQACDWIDEELFLMPPFFQLCMGVKWGIPAETENLNFMVKQLPSNAVWSVLGVGKRQLPMIEWSLANDGHIRVGFEDNLYIRNGELAKSNAEFVRMAVELAHKYNRDVASPEEAKRILGISKSQEML